MVKILGAIVAISLVSAASPWDNDDLIRQADAAFERGDFEVADALYSRTEEWAADPGLVAFNKGNTLYRRGDDRRAELCFRRCLGDAAIAPERRSRSLYGLGNCLVRQAGESNVKSLQAAIECYETCLRSSNDEGLRSDAGHNVEIAKLLWARARAKRPPGERDPEWDDPREPKPPPDPRTQPDDGGPDHTGKGENTLDPSTKWDGGKGAQKGVQPQAIDQPTPGKGSLPVITDRDEVQSLSSEDAKAVLKHAVERLHRERQKLRQELSTGERPRANDW